ncbi:hypothetical protein ANO11243_056880 [Dothideomycetidae sp. 11243]|nr:hypothetical protein ANO11243_056880 [fungal sp. No.11243]
MSFNTGTGGEDPRPSVDAAALAQDVNALSISGPAGAQQSPPVPDAVRRVPARKAVPSRKPVPQRKSVGSPDQPTRPAVKPVDSGAGGGATSPGAGQQSASKPALLEEAQSPRGPPHGSATSGCKGKSPEGNPPGSERTHHSAPPRSPDYDPDFPEHLKLPRSAPMFNLSVVAAKKVDPVILDVMLNQIVSRHTLDIVNTGDSSFTEHRSEALGALVAAQQAGLEALYSLELSDDAQQDIVYLLFELHQEVPPMSDAQNLSLAAPPNWPINKSVFKHMPIPFEYDHDQYNKDIDYRYWVGERVLDTTDQKTLDDYKAEIMSRSKQPRPMIPEIPQPLHVTYDSTLYYHNVRRMHERMNKIFAEENAAIGPMKTGWVRMPGVLGPKLEWPPNAVWKLPEMHNCIFGDVHPNNSKALRFPQARNWLTLEELVRFPLHLPRVNPFDFRRITSPEMKFTDRFGVTIKGVTDVKQCTQTSEHAIFTYHLFENYGYEEEFAAHGITYEDYHRYIAGSLEIIGRHGVQIAAAKLELKAFFYEVSENLRARGVPIVIKYKGGENDNLTYHTQQLIIRHQPLTSKMRRSIFFSNK